MLNIIILNYFDEFTFLSFWLSSSECSASLLEISLSSPDSFPLTRGFFTMVVSLVCPEGDYYRSSQFF